GGSETESMALSNNGYLAITTGGGTIQLWKQNGDSFLALSSITSATTSSLSFSQNADYLVISDGTIYRRKGDSFAVLGTPTGAPGSPTSYAFSPNGRYLGGTDSTNAYIWRVPSSSNPAIADFGSPTQLTPGGGGLDNITFSPDGQFFATS